MAFAETAPLIAQLDLKGNFTSSLRKAQGQLGAFSGSLGKAGKGVGQLGAGFARVGAIAGTAIVGGLVGAAKAAIDFEDAFAGVRKTVDEAELKAAGLSFDDLAKQFRTMATEIPIAATELARLGEAAGALGIKANDIDDFTKTAALLGVTTDLTADQAAESLGKIGTILNFTGKDFENFADVLVNLGNKGASVESEIAEITKRFAASGKQAGLSTDQILAYASAIASAGAAPEAAGSSLSRLFGNLITETALATGKGKAFADVTGKSFKDFAKIVKDDTNGAMLLFLDSLKDLDKFSQQIALEDVGITNVRDRNAILLLAETYDQNLIPALDNAKDSAGALSAEATKRFAGLKQQLILLKNNFIEAGITIGEGFTPALGRATAKLIAFLKVDSNKAALKTLGEDIGRSLDGIDWDAVLSGTRQFVAILKDAAGVASGVLKTLNKLPTEIKAAGLGFLALNKLSGGLIGAGAGNLFAGLAETIIKATGSRLPGAAGALFAQPVRVVNWPPGMGMGGLGAAGAAATGLWSKVGTLIGGAFTVVAVAAIAEQIHSAISPEGGLQGRVNAGTELPADKLQWPWGPKNTPRWIIDSPFGKINVLGGDSVFTPEGEPLGPPTPRGWANRGPEVFGPPAPPTSGGREARSTFSVDAAMLRGIAAGFKPTAKAGEATVQRNLERLAAQNLAATQAVKTEAARTTAAAQQTAFAIRDKANTPPPVTNVRVNVNVTAAQVSKSVVIQRRYGPSGGSRERGGVGGAQEF